MKAYVEAGFPPEKLIVLTSTYGYLYSLKICSKGGKDTVRSVQKLNNVCIKEILEQENFYTMWDDVRKVPYSTLMRGSSVKWITFNDLESHRHKAEFVRKYELGGIGVFTLDQDAGECSDGIPFPFLWTLVKVIRPEMAVRVLPGVGCAGVSETCSAEACDDDTEAWRLDLTKINGEDVMVRYVPDQPCNGCLKSKIVDPSSDVLYKPGPETVTCNILPLTSTTTEVVTTSDTTTTTTEEVTTTSEIPTTSTTDFISMDTSDSTSTTEELPTTEASDTG